MTLKSKQKRKTTNITLSIDDDLLTSGREYAAQQGQSLNELIRLFLQQTTRGNKTDWLKEIFATMDKLNVKSNGKHWTRDEIYDL